MEKLKSKICIVVGSLANGGLERTTALLSKMLEKADYDVHLALLENKVDYEYGGKLYSIDEGKNLKKENIIQKWKRFGKFRKYLQENKFDYVIDARCRANPIIEIIYLFIIYKGIKKIYTIHSFKIKNYLTRHRCIGKLIIHKSDKIICVSKEIEKAVHQLIPNKKSTVIYNPIEVFNSKQLSPIPSKYILFLGRVDDETKNLKLLIDAYRLSQLNSAGVWLMIVGDGPSKNDIEKYITDQRLNECVQIRAYTPDVYNYLKNAHFLVLSSRYEGFPVVLVESLSIGTPVVSVDCKSGPNEIIIHEKNGLLVENYNPQKLGDAMKRLFEDKELYSQCKAYAKDSVQHLSQRNIIQEWQKILL